jgi:hypothetical protein
MLTYQRYNSALIVAVQREWRRREWCGTRGCEGGKFFDLLAVVLRRRSREMDDDLEAIEAMKREVTDKWLTHAPSLRHIALAAVTNPTWSFSPCPSYDLFSYKTSN